MWLLCWVWRFWGGGRKSYGESFSGSDGMVIEIVRLSLCVAIFKRIDKKLARLIEEETAKLAVALANGLAVSNGTSALLSHKTRALSKRAAGLQQGRGYARVLR